VSLFGATKKRSNNLEKTVLCLNYNQVQIKEGFVSTLLSKGPPTVTVMCKYYAFKGAPPPSSLLQIKKSFKPTSLPKKL